MVTKASWDAVVRMLLAAMHSFFEKFRGDIAAFLAFHENESRRQLIEMNESLDQVRKAMIAMTTLFADKMDAFLAEAKAACAGRASNDYDSALMNKTLEGEAEVKRLANLLTSRVPCRSALVHSSLPPCTRPWAGRYCERRGGGRGQHPQRACAHE